jgi:hypothetical protein
VDVNDQPEAASAITEALTDLRARDGDEPVYRCATASIEAATIFLLRALGPMAARKALLSAVAVMDATFERDNGGSEYLQ